MLVVIEVSPIKDLSVNSKPGIKVLLRGKISIRGNAVVLGCCVPYLLKVQKKALNVARRIAGVGNDHTVRALVWNPYTGSEKEQDEADHESQGILSTPTAVRLSSLNDSSYQPPSNLHTVLKYVLKKCL